MQFEQCRSSVLRSRSLLPDHGKGIADRRASRLRAVDTADQFGETRRGGSRTLRRLPWDPVSLRRHVSAPGVRFAALVSSVADGEAGAVPTLAARSLDLLAALR